MSEDRRGIARFVRKLTHRPLRVFGAAGAGALALAVAASCQNRPAASTSSAPTGEAQVVKMSSLKAPEGPATQPAGTDANGREVAAWVKALGFTYAAAPS